MSEEKSTFANEAPSSSSTKVNDDDDAKSKALTAMQVVWETDCTGFGSRDSIEHLRIFVPEAQRRPVDKEGLVLQKD